jgi:AraC-like DNA-binding protein
MDASISNYATAHTLDSLNQQFGVEVHEPTLSNLQHDTKVLSGRFSVNDYGSGISIHATDMEEEQDLDMAFNITPRLTLCVLLEGELEFTLAGQHQHVHTRHGQGSQVFVIATDQEQQLTRHIRKGHQVRKVNVTVMKTWLEREATHSAVIRDILHHHFHNTTQCVHWQATPLIVGFANRILNPSPATATLRDLQVQYHAIELLNAVLQQLTLHSPQSYEQALGRAQAYIESQLHTALNLNQVAKHAGLSVSTLQRQFKSHYQQTVVQYIRRRKLEVARDSLARKDKSIGEVAFLAGYHHVSNFATAYKKAFGETPGEQREKRVACTFAHTTQR